MIRLRKKDKTSYDVPSDKCPFVELVNDLDGSVMKLFIMIEPGRLLQVEPNSVDAERYAALMKDQGVFFTGMVINRK